MKKTFYTLSALALGASMVFTSCGNGNVASEAAPAAADSTSVILCPSCPKQPRIPKKKPPECLFGCPLHCVYINVL